MSQLHLRKLCVGVESLDDLRRWQEGRLRRTGGALWHRTRTWPRRHAEILAGGGSLYWIIKGAMSCRQPITGFEAESHEDPDERPYCRILLGPDLIATDPWPHRPFQGWRYLKSDEAPPDLGAAVDDDALPPTLAAELRALGRLVRRVSARVDPRLHAAAGAALAVGKWFESLDSIKSTTLSSNRHFFACLAGDGGLYPRSPDATGSNPSPG